MLIQVDEVKLKNEIDSFDQTKNILSTDFDKVNDLKKIHFTGCLSSGFYTLKIDSLSHQKSDLIINLGRNISLSDKRNKNDFISSFYVKKSDRIKELSYYDKQNNLTYKSLRIEYE